MQNNIKYSYGYYKDGNYYIIECLNNYELFGQSESKEDILKNAVDFTTGIIKLCLVDKVPFPDNKSLVRNRSKYEKVFNLYFDAKTSKYIQKQSEKV